MYLSAKEEERKVREFQQKKSTIFLFIVFVPAGGPPSLSLFTPIYFSFFKVTIKEAYIDNYTYDFDPKNPKDITSV